MMEQRKTEEEEAKEREEAEKLKQQNILNTMENMTALASLIIVFQRMSAGECSPFWDLRAELTDRWVHRDSKGHWKIKGTIVDGCFEFIMRDEVMIIRCFRGDGDNEESIVRLRIFLARNYGLDANMEFLDDHDARTLSIRLLESISYGAHLKSLERSLARGISRYLSKEEMRVAGGINS